MTEEKTPPPAVQRTLDELLQASEESSAVDELFDELDRKASKTLLDEAQLRRQEDWSVLANQIVGGESFSGT